MTTLWRALGAHWRQPPAFALGPEAVAGVRAWQHALADAAPPRLAIDAWPREPDVAPLLEPMAQSPLAGLRDEVAARSAPVAADRATRRLAAPPEVARAARRAFAGEAGFTATPRAAAAQVAGGAASLRWNDAPPGDTGAARTSPPAATASVAPAAAAARIAALLARHAAQRAAVEAPAPASQARSRSRALPATTPRAGAAVSNVVTLHPRRPPREPQAAGLAPALDRWSQLLEGGPASPQRIQALLERGQRLPLDLPVLPPVLRPRVPRGEPLPADEPHAVLASRPPSSAGAALRPPVPPSAPPSAPPSPVPAAPWPEAERAALAGLAASLARIEDQLVAASASASPPAPAAAPQWLDDDDHLADRIHDILRRQARRHGIDTP